MIAMTIDTEWCPDAVIEDTLSLLNRYGIEATLFSTHPDGLAADSHERALHPNFLQEGIPEREVLATVAEHYPEATGIRSHSMYVHSRLRELYPEFGLQYESNYMQYLVEGIEPFWMLDGIVQLPVYFMDDMWFRSRSDHGNLPAIDTLLTGEGLKVFDFHPVHVYLNTVDVEHYRANRDQYDDPEALRSGRSDGPGVRDLFQGLLKTVSEADVTVRTLGELFESFADRHPESEIHI